MIILARSIIHCIMRDIEIGSFVKEYYIT